MSIFIYHLIDSAGHVRYVGASADPARRLAQHEKDANRGRRTPFAIFHRGEIGKCCTLTMRVVSTVPDELDWREVERKAIIQTWVAGEPILNVQSIRRGKWKCDTQDGDVQLTRQLAHMAKLLRRADIYAHLDGRDPLFADVPRDHEAESSYIINTIGWWPGSFFDRMYRRLKAERRRDWQATDLVDDLGLAYPPIIYYGQVSGIDDARWEVVDDERLMSAADYEWSMNWSACIAEEHMQMEHSMRAHGMARFGDEAFAPNPPLAPRRFAPDSIKAKWPSDPRFSVLEHLRHLINQPIGETNIMEFADGMLADAAL